MFLNKIVKQIRDEAARIVARHAAARENCPVSAVIEQRPIETLDELMSMSVDYFQHQFKHAVLQDPNAPDLPQDMVWAVAGVIVSRFRLGLIGAATAGGVVFALAVVLANAPGAALSGAGWASVLATAVPGVLIGVGTGALVEFDAEAGAY